MYNIIKKAFFVSISFLLVCKITKFICKLRKNVLWIEFKSDIQEYGFLNALNRLNFEVGYLKTVALSPERDIVYEKYKLRKAQIAKLRRKFHM